jgi:hypothetical protein
MFSGCRHLRRHERVPAAERHCDRSIWYSFMGETFYISLSTGCCKAMIAVAVSQFGPLLGSYFIGTLYGAVIISSLCFASVATSIFGSKACLLGGISSYVVLFAGYVAAVLAPSIKWPSIILGAFVSGLGSGILWTGHGVYFARCCTIYAEESECSLNEASKKLAEHFAAVYLLCEVVLKLVASPILQLGGALTFTAAYLVITIIAVAGMRTIRDVEEPLEEPKGVVHRRRASSSLEESVESPPRKSTLAMLGSSMQLLYSSRKLQLIGAFEMSFGVFSTFINFYVNGTVIGTVLGKHYVGYFAAFLTTVAAAVNVALSSACPVLASGKHAKAVLMAVGGLSFAAVGVPFLVLEMEQLNVLLLVLVYFLGGIGRASFEGANRR